MTWNAEYKEMVATFIKEDSNIKFGNLTTKHAADICSQFIDSAQNSIEIFSGSMKEIFYSEHGIFEKLRAAAARLKRAGAIRIITVNASPDDIKSLRKRITDINKVNNYETIKYIPAKYDGADMDLAHFMLVDNKRYRLEEPHPRFDSMPEEVKASVCCNDPATVRDQKVFFDGVWNSLEGGKNECANR